VIAIPADLDLDNPKDIAQWLWQNLPDEVRYKYDSGSGDGSCWIIENNDSRFAIGEDPIDGEGLCWASYTSDHDPREVYWDHRASGGWAAGDADTAKREIEYAFGLFDNPYNLK
jgi:hypothetical protein